MLPVIALILLFLAWGTDVSAQCAMCRGTVETGLEEPAEGQSLNNGILYLMTIPYVLLGTIFFLWWRFRKKPQTAAKHS